ncbi:MAG: T9SS C-terminal target domain-containing protein [Bacteroidetes bacterium]|nr:MAG: T9SS C-terminal target domain-containing protein [Bacteroidota bacterium]
MKFFFTFSLLFSFLFVPTTYSQYVNSVEFISSASADEISELLDYDVDNGAHFYKMTYHTTGSDGMSDIASGLIVIPDNMANEYPLVIYHHGTSPARDEVPSSLSLDFEAYAGIGASGYAVLAPDYLGMGDSRGFHPYVHRETQARASVDMLKAFHEWLEGEDYAVNHKLFLTGYSQGGHASMSTHKELELNHSAEFTVTAATHLSGPYSISGVMRDLMFSETNYLYVGFIPYLILGYQEVYGNVYEDLTDIFQPVFIPSIEAFYNGQINLIDLTIALIFLSAQNYGNSYPVTIFNPELVAEMTSDDNHPLNVILRENDTFNWAPQAPTRIFYCLADDMVPFENSIVADSVMQANGALDLVSENLSSTMGHGECAFPALLETVEFFNGFIETSTEQIAFHSQLSLYPNPTDGRIIISGLSDFESYNLQVVDISGKVLMSQVLSSEINLDHLQSGVYFLRISGNSGVITHKVIRN